MAGETVLLIDTDISTVQQITSSLETNDYLVFTATSADDCFRMAERVSPSLIFINLNLSGASSLEICKSLHQTENLKHVPFVIITTHSGKIDDRHKELYGIVDALIKPFTPEDVVEKAEKVLAAGQSKETKDKGNGESAGFGGIDISATSEEDAQEESGEGGFNGIDLGGSFDEEESSETAEEPASAYGDIDIGESSEDGTYGEEEIDVEKLHEEAPAPSKAAVAPPASARSSSPPSSSAPPSQRRPVPAAAPNKEVFEEEEELPSPGKTDSASYRIKDDELARMLEESEAEPEEKPVTSGVQAKAGTGRPSPMAKARAQKTAGNKGLIIGAAIVVVLLFMGGAAAYLYLEGYLPWGKTAVTKKAGTSAKKAPEPVSQAKVEPMDTPQQAAAPAAPASPAPSPTVPATPAPAAPAAGAKSVQPPPAPPAVPAAAKPGEESFFAVQIGSFTDIRTADPLLTSFKGKGYDAYVSEGTAKGNSRVFRVLIGKYKTRPEAAQQADSIRTTEKVPVTIFYYQAEAKTAATAPAAPTAASASAPVPVPAKLVKAPEAKKDGSGKAGGFYSAQVGAFGERSNAEEIAKTFKGKGYEAFVHEGKKGGKPVFRVLIGKFGSKSEAEEGIKTLKSMDKISPVLFKAD